MAGGAVAALIPAYQAAATVGDVVRGVLGLVPQVLVVDDGSTDATAEAARAAGAEVVRHAANRGKGAALVTGLAHLAGAGATHALTLDADGQHLPGEIPKLLAASARQPQALVIGVRLKEGHAIRGINRLGNWVADSFMTWIGGTMLLETPSGFGV